MKRIVALPLAFALAAFPALAQTGAMGGMDMKGMDKKGPSDKATGKQHQGSGVVKTVDWRLGSSRSHTNRSRASVGRR